MILSTTLSRIMMNLVVSHYITEGPVNDTSKILGTIQILRKGISPIKAKKLEWKTKSLNRWRILMISRPSMATMWLKKRAERGRSLSSYRQYNRDNARTPCVVVKGVSGLGFSDGSAWLISPKTRCYQCGKSGKRSQFHLELLSPADRLVPPSPIRK